VECSPGGRHSRGVLGWLLDGPDVELATLELAFLVVDDKDLAFVDGGSVRPAFTALESHAPTVEQRSVQYQFGFPVNRSLLHGSLL
jgi:hypothetical protein